MTERQSKSKKKYVFIVKVSNSQFVKYRANDIVKFVNFLDTNWNGWRWFNVYDNITKQQINSVSSLKRVF